MTKSTPRVFVSYARTDSEFVSRLARDLATADITAWMDVRDIVPGNRWDVSVDTALREATDVVLILSPDACASQNVMDEVSFALANNTRVIPLFCLNCDIPFRWQRIQRIDMSIDYASGFATLLETLGQPRPELPVSTGARTPASKGSVTVHHVDGYNVVIADTVGDINFNSKS